MRATILICIVAFVCLAGAVKLQRGHFQRFVDKYNKHYTPEQFDYRQKIFLSNLARVAEFNNQENEYELGINEFADLTHEEFVAKMLSPSLDYSDNVEDNSTFSADFVAPTALDYRTNSKPKIVGPVRNQGACAAPVAAAIVDSISGDYSVRFTEDFYQFDLGYITDCNTGGCTGQTATSVWNFIKKFGMWWYYDVCPTGPGVGMCISGNTCVGSGKEADLLTAVASKGPIAIQIDASQSSFQLYKSGVYYDAKCSSTTLNHALLLVGYGTQNGTDYWIARNSWGTTWGQNGDILLSRNKSNNCGVATSACYATVVQNCVCEN